MGRAMSEPAKPDPTPEAARRTRRRHWRERALLLAPALAFGSVILTIWVLAAWYVAERPGELRQQQRHELATAVREVAMQTEPVLRQAESALRTVDLWL